MARLTRKLIETTLPAAKDQFRWDSEVRGFAVRIWPSGRKTFVAKYRVGGGRSGVTRRLTGSYSALTVEEARTQASKVRGAVADGSDPAAAGQGKRREMTVLDLIGLYAAEGTGHLNDRNRRWMLNRLGHHVAPLLGRKNEFRCARG